MFQAQYVTDVIELQKKYFTALRMLAIKDCTRLSAAFNLPTIHFQSLADMSDVDFDGFIVNLRYWVMSSIESANYSECFIDVINFVSSPKNSVDNFELWNDMYTINNEDGFFRELIDCQLNLLSSIVNALSFSSDMLIPFLNIKRNSIRNKNVRLNIPALIKIDRPLFFPNPSLLYSLINNGCVNYNVAKLTMFKSTPFDKVRRLSQC